MLVIYQFKETNQPNQLITRVEDLNPRNPLRLYKKIFDLIKFKTILSTLRTSCYYYFP